MSRVSTDLLLVHAPAFFDFRGRSDIYFPYLSTSGAVPVTPLYEYFPLGFKTLQRFLGARGHLVRIVNLASVFLRYPALDLAALLDRVDARLVGIDLHWMAHVQGSLAIAERFKAARADVPLIFGGISSCYYAAELIRYPFVDMVMRGYDTHEPMAALMTELKNGRRFGSVPNLLWKDRDARVVDNGVTHLPNTFACGIDWSDVPRQDTTRSLPILEVMSTQNAGCAYDCGWCGGSRAAFRRIYGRRRAMARKSRPEVAYEFSTLDAVPNVEKHHYYANGTYNESPGRLKFFIDQVAASRVKSISYEQFRLTPPATLRAMAKANPRTSITLSPESHDLRIAKLAGRGVYAPAEMERWIAKALDLGIHEIDVWYFIGMPEQDARSVRETVDYCARLLRLFKGQRVVPLLCPMIPFLDPASTFFERPAAHGYTVFFRTVEEHRRGMERASLVNRLNYETRWLSRRDLVPVGYAAVRRLVEIKGEIGALPSGIASSVIRQIDDATEFIDVVDRVDSLTDPQARAAELARVGGDIRRRNDAIFYAGVANQAFPVNREIGGRWFDETLWDDMPFEEGVRNE